jgi:diguanylate cyclase (GGDEF)-like protein
MLIKQDNMFDAIEFREEFNALHRIVSRVIYIILFFALVLFSVWDMFVIGFDHPLVAEFVLKRYLTPMPLLFIGIAFTFIESKKIRMDWLMTFACILIGISVIQIYILFHDIGRVVTIDGLMLFMVSVFFVPSIFAFQKIIVSLFTITGYLFFLWVADKDMMIFFHAIIYFGLIVLGGAVQSLSFDKKLKENFSSQKKLKKMAHTDHLTGAHNRHKFEDDFNEVLLLANKERAFVGLYIVDIDQFKEFNDHYGHLEGDDCLVAIAQELLAHCEHKQDRCIRFGGEEFILVKYGRSLNELQIWGENLLESVQSLGLKHEYSSVSDVVTVSIGAAFIDQGKTETRTSLMAKADKALYKAKKSGRNKFLVSD